MPSDIRPVTETNFADLAALFEARGGPDYCWCMAWRPKPSTVTRAKGAEGKALRKAAMAENLSRHVHVGLLAYVSGAPVGWVSTGPLAGFSRLGGPRDVDTETTWAISCFFIARPHRGRGLTRALTRAAIGAARQAGAQLFQVTAVDPASPSYRFMGMVPMYAAMGFEDVGMAGTRRHVMRLKL